MPEPRHDRAATVPVRVTLEPGSRDPAAYQRRIRSGRVRGRKGPDGSLPVEIRNGLPWKPYVYRGLGYDIYESAEDGDA